MSTQCATTSACAVKGHRRVLSAVLAVASICACPYTYGQETSRVNISPPFRWPTSMGSMVQANRTPRAQVEAFYKAIRTRAAGGAAAAGLIRLNQFRFALLGPGDVCLVTTGGEKLPWFLGVTCPAPGGFNDTTVMDERMGLLATDLLDLDGDGFDEVISSQFAGGYGGASAPPIYWYTIYSFKDGLPHDVSREFQDFYQAEVVEWGYRIGRLITPMSGGESRETALAEALITFTRLKYQRKILGQGKAGLSEALVWAGSSEADLQNLAVMTLRDINDPSSIAAIEKLAASKYQGVCREAVEALAGFQHREATGRELESRCKSD